MRHFRRATKIWQPIISQKESRIDEQTRQYYESLTLDEQAELIGWLEGHFDEIPIPRAVKKRGMDNLTIGIHQARSSLLLIRYAMKALDYSLE